MANQEFEIIFRAALPPAEGGCPKLNPRTERADGMIIQYDVAVPMRDGAKICIDIYRPETEGRYPVLLAWGPYGKFGRVKYSHLGNTGLDDEDFNQYSKFEAADPVYWCRNGYIIVNADQRGS